MCVYIYVMIYIKKTTVNLEQSVNYNYVDHIEDAFFTPETHRKKTMTYI